MTTPTQQENRKLRHQKRAQSVLSYGTAATGLSALGLKGASSVVSRGKLKLPAKVPGSKLLLRPKKAAKKLNRASVGILTAGAGLGGVGSLNFASIQNQEAKKIKIKKNDVDRRHSAERDLEIIAKGLPSHAHLPGKGQVRVLGQHSKDHFMVLTDRDEKVLAHRSRLTFIKSPKPKKPKPPGGTVSKSAFGVEHGEVAKAFDPEERRQRRSGVAIGSLAAGSAAAGAGAVRQGAKTASLKVASRKQMLSGLALANEGARKAKGMKPNLSGGAAKAVGHAAGESVHSGLKSIGQSQATASMARKSARKGGKLALVAAGTGAGALALNAHQNRGGKKYKTRWA